MPARTAIGNETLPTTTTVAKAVAKPRRQLLKRALGEILRRELPLDQTGLLTVNEVDVSSDFRAATVYVGVVGTAAQKKTGMNILNHERKRIQSLVGKAVVLKYTPLLRFVVDDSIERGNKILKIIDELEQSEKATP